MCNNVFCLFQSIMKQFFEWQEAKRKQRFTLKTTLVQSVGMITNRRETVTNLLLRMSTTALMMSSTELRVSSV